MGAFEPLELDIYEAPYSAIVGIAVLDEVRRAPRGRDPWWCGPVGWYLRAPVVVPPVPCAGGRGLWLVPEDTAEDLRETWCVVRERSAA